MTTRIAAVLAACAAIITGALLLLLPMSASYSGVSVPCGTVFSPDTHKAEVTDNIHQLGDHGFKAACDSAAAGRVGWGIGLGAVGLLSGAAAVVLFTRRTKPKLAATSY